MGQSQIQAVRLTSQEHQGCVACGGSDLLRISMLPDVALYRCRLCGSAETHPRRTRDQLDTAYQQSYYGPENVKFVSWIERAVAQLTRFRARQIDHLLRRKSRILEVGCGRGQLLKALSDLGHECYGTERSELAAFRARQTPGITVYCKPLAECGIQENSLDLIILWHVLEHLDDLAKEIQVLFKLLNKGGMILVEVPNYTSFQSRLAKSQWFHLDLNHHLFHFSDRGLRELLTRIGLQPAKLGTFNLEQCPYGVLQSWLNMLGLPRDQLYRILKKEVSVPLAIRIANYLLATLLTLPATVFSLVEALLDSGGVLRFCAKKETDVVPIARS